MFAVTKRIRLIVGSLFLLIALWAILPAMLGKPKGYPNHGSCLLYVATGMEKLKEWQREHGELPCVDGSSTAALKLTGLDEDDASSLEYLNRPKTQIDGKSRVIVLMCTHTTKLSPGKEGRYVGLLSGEIMVVESKMARLGDYCPPGERIDVE